MRKDIASAIRENRYLAKQLVAELEILLAQARRQSNRYASPGTEHQQLAALRAVKRLRARAESFSRSLRVVEDNLELHAGAISKLDQIDAATHKALTDADLDALAIDYDAALDTHAQTADVSRLPSEADLTMGDEREWLERLRGEVEPETPPSPADPEPAPPEPEPAPEPPTRPRLEELA